MSNLAFRHDLEHAFVFEQRLEQVERVAHAHLRDLALAAEIEALARAMGERHIGRMPRHDRERHAHKLALHRDRTRSASRGRRDGPDSARRRADRRGAQDRSRSRSALRSKAESLASLAARCRRATGRSAFDGFRARRGRPPRRHLAQRMVVGGLALALVFCGGGASPSAARRPSLPPRGGAAW